MKKSQLVKGICVASVVAICSFAMAACSAQGGSGKVAATVNGVEISEDKVTNYIQEQRTSMGLDTEEAWGEYLASYGYTPETIREQVIDSFVRQELISQGAEAEGITVDSATIDSNVESIKSYYDSDEAWQTALQSAGLTEDEYRKNIELSLKAQQLQNKVAPTTDPTDEQMMNYAKMFSSYYNGMKRSSHILFASGDEATAQDVLNQINAGTLDFAEAAKQYSTDTGSAVNGGDVGWDKMSSFVTEYTDALNGLGKDQVSGLVTSEFGIHIIKCTDVFTAPEELTSVSELPEALQEEIKSYTKDSLTSTSFDEWITAQKDAADIVINDMPADVPYNVDMSKYQTDSSATGVETEGAVEGSGDTTVEVTTEQSAQDESSEQAAEGSSEPPASDGAAESSDAAK